MSRVDQKLVDAIVSKAIDEVIEEAEATLILGFNVRLVFSESESSLVLLKVTENRVRKRKKSYILVTLNGEDDHLATSSDVSLKPQLRKPACLVEPKKQSQEMILVLETQMEPAVGTGNGFLTMCMPLLVDLLPSVGTCIEKVLEHFQLQLYSRSFRTEHRKALKKVLTAERLDVFVDTVVQIAFAEGVRGEEFTISQLNKHISQISEPLSNMAPNNEQIGLVLDWIIQTTDRPLFFLKALASFYATEVRKMPQTVTAKRLVLSRSTLQIYLKAAHQLGIDHLLIGGKAAEPCRAPQSHLNIEEEKFGGRFLASCSQSVLLNSENSPDQKVAELGSTQ